MIARNVRVTEIRFQLLGAVLPDDPAHPCPVTGSRVPRDPVQGTPGRNGEITGSRVPQVDPLVRLGVGRRNGEITGSMGGRVATVRLPGRECHKNWPIITLKSPSCRNGEITGSRVPQHVGCGG